MASRLPIFMLFFFCCSMVQRTIINICLRLRARSCVMNLHGKFPPASWELWYHPYLTPHHTRNDIYTFQTLFVYKLYTVCKCRTYFTMYIIHMMDLYILYWKCPLGKSNPTHFSHFFPYFSPTTFIPPIEIFEQQGQNTNLQFRKIHKAARSELECSSE